MNRLLTVLLAFAFAHCCEAVRCDEADGDATRSKYGATDVEIRLRDGSTVRGEITSPESLTLKTAYGTLNIPVTRVVSLRAGLRVSTVEDTEITAAIKDLDSDEYNVRGQAQKKLESLASRAAPALRQARDKASPEARTRIDALLKKSSGAETKPNADDSVKSDEFEAAGKLEIETLTVKNRIGDLKVKLADIDSVRWLARGSAKNITLEGQAALEDWVDTGMESNPGDKIVVSCSGTINLFGQYESTPTGCNNYGGARSFLVGAVIGRVGLSGKPFLIGNAKTWVPQVRGRLFLKIYCMDNLLNNGSNPTTGSYTARVSSGYLADAAQADEPGK